MFSKTKAIHIFTELKEHAPFTLAGTLAGVLFVLLLRGVGQQGGHTLFVIFHPAHVVLSAMVTASLFRLHRKTTHILVVMIIGYTGSVGVATLSDSVIPFIGQRILGLDIPSHAQLHEHVESDDHLSEHRTDLRTDYAPQHGTGYDAELSAGHAPEHDAHHDQDSGPHTQAATPHRPGLHFGFIEEWYLVNPAAILGIALAFVVPRTKFPHAGHVLISTWASLSYLLMNMQQQISVAVAAGIFVVLFLAVLLPCCISDIVFPLLFVKPDPADG